jgi:hypothetical protein
METGIVVGSRIAKNKDGERPRRILSVVVTDPEDAQTVEWTGQPGRDSGIVNDDVVLIKAAGETKFAFANDDGITPEALNGDEHFYSRSGGSKAAEVILRTNGDIELNGDDDFVVSYNRLAVILGQLASDINANLTAIAAQVPGYTPTPIVIDLDPAKVEDVKVREP